LLIEGLRRLEYRGYDSAGICTLAGGALQVRKQLGRVEGLAQSLKAKPVTGTLGISHTRWAVHDLPSDINVHPHLDLRSSAVRSPGRDAHDNPAGIPWR
jgi:glucosamine--fructose-6-phosphate aminotransferase (isomerizing)